MSRKTKPAGETVTEEEKRFVEAYLANGGRGGPAYRRVHPQVTAASARQLAYKALMKVDVQAYLQARQSAMWKAWTVDAEEAVALVGASSKADVAWAYDEHGNLLPPHRWPLKFRMAVQSITDGPFGRKVTLHNGLHARELILKMHGRLKDTMEHTFNWDAWLQPDAEPEPATPPNP